MSKCKNRRKLQQFEFRAITEVFTEYQEKQIWCFAMTALPNQRRPTYQMTLRTRVILITLTGRIKTKV